MRTQPGVVGRPFTGMQEGALPFSRFPISLSFEWPV